MTALHTMGVAAVAELVRRREISPVEVVEACLARLETLEPQLQAWVTVDRHGALAAAKQCEQAVQRGLIHYWAGEGCITVHLVRYCHPVEPRRPALIEVPFDANFVDCHRSSFPVPLLDGVS